MTGVFPFEWRPWQLHTYPYVSPRNAEIADKPVANCAKPISTLDPEYQQRRYGSGPGLWVPMSMNHWMMVPEIAPYLESYSSWECCFWLWGVTNMFWANAYIGRKSAGQVNPLNPRTAWAHRVVLWTTIARIQCAWLFAVVPGIHSYEFLYTHVPGFKINDPSTEGWKQGWKEGQSTYAARTAASLWTYVGWWIYKGQHKRGVFWTGTCIAMQWYYEFIRIYCGPASDRALYFIASEDSRKMERHGSLAPETYRNFDGDANKPHWIYSYENLRFLHNSLAVQAEINKAHEYQPLCFFMPKIPNPYFDFQKAAQVDRDSNYRYKSDVFKLPEVLSVTMRTGALDDTMTA